MFMTDHGEGKKQAAGRRKIVSHSHIVKLHDNCGTATILLPHKGEIRVE